MLVLEIPGVPIAKKRPKFFIRRLPENKILTGAQNTQITEEGKFLAEVHRQLPVDWSPYLHHVSLKVTAWFFVPIPTSYSKKALQAILDGKLFPTTKPDLDNLIKFTFDCLNGVVWNDDRQVHELDAHKRFSDRPRTEITVEEVAL